VLYEVGIFVSASIERQRQAEERALQQRLDTGD